jgi:hypothetical protein
MNFSSHNLQTSINMLPVAMAVLSRSSSSSGRSATPPCPEVMVEAVHVSLREFDAELQEEVRELEKRYDLLYAQGAPFEQIQRVRTKLKETREKLRRFRDQHYGSKSASPLVRFSRRFLVQEE